jgi:hypothetical protein
VPLRHLIHGAKKSLAGELGYQPQQNSTSAVACQYNIRVYTIIGTESKLTGVQIMGGTIEAMDAGVLAEQVKRTHGSEALNYAVGNARQHLLTAAWKSAALWLRVVNSLNSTKTPI